MIVIFKGKMLHLKLEFHCKLEKIRFFETMCENETTLDTVIWLSKKRPFSFLIRVLFSKFMLWLHQFFEENALGNHFNRKFENLLFLVSGFKQKNGQV